MRQQNQHTDGFPVGYRSSGFTLLEMMLTVGLIALTATFVGISISSSDSRIARLEAERFIALVNLAQDESIMTGQPIVLQVNADARQYQFEVLDFGLQTVNDIGEVDAETKTAPLADEFLKARNIPESVSLSFMRMQDERDTNEVSGMTIQSIHELMNRSIFDDDEEEDLLDSSSDSQEVLIEPNGLISPFSLALSNAKETLTIEVDRFGRAAIMEPQ